MKYLGVRQSVLFDTDRGGSTLTEVLISLLIASIGMVSLATLFPIAVLRTVQATNLTNATILRYNAEAIIDAKPVLVHDPDLDGNVDEHFRNPVNRNYIVDPLGYYLIDAALQGTFGRDKAMRVPRQPPPADTPAGTLARFKGYENEAAAINGVVLPDSWVLQTDGEPTAISTTSATMPADIDLTSVLVSPIGISEITLFDITRRHSRVRPISAIDPNSNIVSWTDALDDWQQLSSRFTPEGFVQIRTQQRQYSWLLTVRKQADGKANVDVVVFFRRSFSSEDEQIYPASFTKGSFGVDGQPGVAGVDDDLDGTLDNASEQGFPGSDDNRTVGNVRWIGEQPFMKKGGFVFDAVNARWYRIQDIRNETGTSADLLLESDIIEQAGEDLNQNETLDDPSEDANGNATLDRGQAIFMRGVVEVFSIAKKSL